MTLQLTFILSSGKTILLVLMNGSKIHSVHCLKITYEVQDLHHIAEMVLILSKNKFYAKEEKQWRQDISSSNILPKAQYHGADFFTCNLTWSRVRLLEHSILLTAGSFRDEHMTPLRTIRGLWDH